jgi:sugar/nucleoside kinase (ribokinase family)
MVAFVTFGLILDDIVFPDGRAAMGVLGGGGPQAAFGMRLWADSVGLVAGVGADLPESARSWLGASGIDVEGVRASEHPTPRAWQLLEADGRRTQVWRVPGQALGAQLSRAVRYLPERYRRARGFHFGTHPDAPDLDFARDLRALGGLVSLEPFRPADRPPASEALRALLAAADVFSLNAGEARSLVGAGEPREMARRLAEAGARVLALRLGEGGSLAIDAQAGRAAHVPAVPVRVVDPVGAGNAYGGGFVVGWVETHDIVEAGLRGAVAASFLVEQIGVPLVTDEIRAEARKRVETLRSGVERIEI